MNQRIQELIEQAEKYAEEKSTWRGDNTEWRNEFEGIFKEKFAELIVRECIQAVDNVGGYNEEFHMNAIKAHFGVEE